MRRIADARRARGALVLCSLACVALGAASPAGEARTIASPQPPQARTGGAQHVSETSVSLAGSVNPRGTATTYYFQYGTTTAYGSQTPAASAGEGTTAVKVSQPLANLQLGTTYHYRLIATSTAGATPVEGLDRTFTTHKAPLRFVMPARGVTVPYGRPFALTGTLSGVGGANHPIAAATSPFPYLAGFGALGQPSSTNAEGGFSLRIGGLTQASELRVQTLDALPTYSPVVHVTVSVLVTLRARRSSPAGLVHLTGTITPAEPGARVLFQRVREGHGPSRVGEAVAHGAGSHGSRFAAPVSIGKTGDYRALTKVSNGRQVSGTSSTVRIRGVRPAHKRKGKIRAHRRRG